MKTLKNTLDAMSIDKLSWEHIILVIRDLLETCRYYQDKPELYVSKEENFHIDSRSNYKESFSYIQPLVEQKYSGSDIDIQIDITDNLASVFAYLLTLKGLDTSTYIKFEKNIYLEFIVVIGNHYLQRLEETLDLASD